MSKAFWPAGKASIILLPSGEQGAGLFELAKSWAEAGLLGPAFWIFPERIHVKSDQPPVVEAVVLGVNSDRTVIEITVDLFEQLARENLRIVRLVKLRAATPRRESDELQDGIVTHIENYLGWSMPAADARSSDKDPVLDYQPVNLICIPTEFKAASGENFSRMRNGTTVIAAPEDRSTPWSSDAFVRDDAKFEGFTLMHLATVSGIWHGLPVGTLELFERERSAMQQVWISRVFYSGVFTDGLARRVAATFVEEVANPEYDPFAPASGTAFIDEIYEQDYVDVMVQSTFLLDEGTLEYKRPELPGDPIKSKIGVWKQLVAYLVFLLRKLGKVPYWMWMSIKRRVSKKVENSLQGESGALEVGLGLEEQLDIYDQAIISNWSQVLREQKLAQESLTAPIKLSQVKTTHVLWQQLRELVFGSLDGGFDLSWAGFPLIDGDRRPVFESPDAVFPLEDSRWVQVHELPKGLVDANLDKQSDAALLTALDAWIQTAKADQEPTRVKLEEAQGKFDELSTQLKELWDSLATNQGIKLNAKGQEVPVSATEATSIQKQFVVIAAEGEAPAEVAFDLVNAVREYKRVQLEVGQLETELKVLDAKLSEIVSQLDLQIENSASLRRFLDDLNRTYQTKTLSAMESRLRQVRADLSRFEEALNNVKTPELGRLLALRKKFHKSLSLTFLISAGLGSAAVSIYYALSEQDRSNWLEPWQSILFALTSFLVSTLIAGTSYYRGWSQLQRAVTLQHADMNRVVAGYRVAKGEENRLRILYAQATDWLELMRKAVLKPWLVRESWKQTNLRTLDLEKLPFAMRVAQAQDDQEAPLFVLKTAAAQQLLVRGWRTKAFEMLISEVAKLSGKGSSFKVESLDRDLPHASNGARRLMDQFMSQTVVLERVAARHIKPVIEKLQGETMSAARPMVLEVDSDPLSPIRTDPESIVEYAPEQEWGEFLSKSLSLGEGLKSPTTPISALAMADSHIQSGEHEQVVGHVLLPKRIANELPTRDASNLAITPYQESTPAPVDAVIRVDVVGPLELGVTRMMSADAEPKETEPVEEVKIRSKLFD